MQKPFDDIKVLDFTQVVSGPYASYQLALLGAEVVKVERREGEDLRRTHLSREWSERGLAPFFQAVNGQKRSLTLDLQKPEALEIVRKLVRTADVVIENFRPGVMDRLGIGYEALSAINPKLIYCAISAFGQTGPERLGAGYDGKIQALSGIMAMTGFEETGPTRAGFPVCDVIAGMTAAFAISSAVHQRSRTGKGQMIDVSMLEAALAFMSGQIAEYTITGHREKLGGNYSVSRKPTANTFKAGDASILFAVNSEKQFIAMMTTLGRADVPANPKFSNWHMRKQNEAELRAIVETELAKKPAKEWEKILDAAGAPCATIWRLDETLDHPQVVARAAVKPIETPHGTYRLASAGFRLAHGGPDLTRAAPRLGEHNSAVLAELGYSEKDIAQLRASSVV